MSFPLGTPTAQARLLPQALHFVRAGDIPPVVYVYELDPATGAYTPTGIYHDRIKVSVPFPIDIDLTAINKRR